MTSTEQVAARPPLAGAQCPCGLDGHSCPGARMLAAPDDDAAIAAEIYELGVAFVRRWRYEERLHYRSRDPW